MTSWDVFRSKRFGYFISCGVPCYCLRLQYAIYSHQVFACVGLYFTYMYKKSPWLKVKKKTGPKKKKKVFDGEWRKTLADSDKVIMGVTGLTQLLSTCNTQFRVWLERVYLLGICPFCTKQLADP